jgi:hypothetical protein
VGNSEPTSWTSFAGLPSERPVPELAWTFSFLKALDGYELRSSTTAAGRQAEMMPWLPVVVVAVAQIAVRSIRVAGLIWHERVSAKSRCDQLRTAAASGGVLCERRPDGVGPVISARHLATRQGDTGDGQQARGRKLLNDR